jgi:hypothetical protein
MTVYSASRGTWSPERVLQDLERFALRGATRAVLSGEAAAGLRGRCPSAPGVKRGVSSNLS